ncbi:MAG: hypothetical protein AAGE80_15365 [Pseudomonadota bacterium]
MNSTNPLFDAAQEILREARQTLDDEIRGYPGPISGCDAQYNHLLAERRRAHEALKVLQDEIHIPTPRQP